MDSVAGPRKEARFVFAENGRFLAFVHDTCVDSDERPLAALQRLAAAYAHEPIDAYLALFGIVG